MGEYDLKFDSKIKVLRFVDSTNKILKYRYVPSVHRYYAGFTQTLFCLVRNDIISSDLHITKKAKPNLFCAQIAIEVCVT